jgi:prepilin-type N-terminal cleavage/methylation domain-containing protein
MILNNIKTRQKDSGFTIVELLVVIVVIGILAAITIVAYTGFTTRAKASTTQANANSLLQVVNAYTADSAANNGGGGTFASTGGIVAALGAYTNTKIPSGISWAAASANHPLNTDVDVNGIGIIYYAGNGGTGACIEYYNASTSQVVNMFMGAATGYVPGTGVCT